MTIRRRDQGQTGNLRVPRRAKRGGQPGIVSALRPAAGMEPLEPADAVVAVDDVLFARRPAL